MFVLQGLLWNSKYRKTKAQLDIFLIRQRSLLSENAILRREERELIQRDKQLQFLTRSLKEFPALTSQLHSQVEPRLVPNLLLKVIMRMFEPDQALILLRRRKAETDPGREKRFVVAAIACPEDTIKRGMEVGFDDEKLGLVVRTQRLMSREDFERQGQTTRGRLKDEKLDAFEPDLASPMIFNGETVGVVALSRPNDQSVTAKIILRLVSQIGAVAVQNVLAYYQIKQTADVDGLTGLYCKRFMNEKLCELIYQAQEKPSRLSVFLFDLDNFKNYNDTNGHGAGDKLLQQLAKLVGENTRQSDFVGRVGGEEFLVIFTDTNKTQALALAESIRSTISSYEFPYAERQPLGFVSISGGVASFSEDSLDSVKLLRLADEALYRAKAAGRNRVLAVEQYHIGGEAVEPKTVIVDA